MRQAIVVTSIFGITEAVSEFARKKDWDLYYVADEKTPDIPQDFVEANENFHLISVEDQKNDPRFETTKETGFNEFQRKNIGYLHAINNGATAIADIDDDNVPYDDWELWGEGEHMTFIVDPKFPNVYEYFKFPQEPHVWPRGMPLDEVRGGEPNTYHEDPFDMFEIGVVQGMVDGDPDVDAIHRLTVDYDDYQFEERRPVLLDEGCWSAFNAQNTLWADQEVYPYMYLPNTVTMRVTDILRSYVAQYGFWAMGKNVMFSKASVEQDRNEHDLMVDFDDEEANYLDVKGWVQTLEDTELTGEPIEDIQKMYIALINEGYVDAAELEYLNAWIGDIR